MGGSAGGSGGSLLFFLPAKSSRPLGPEEKYGLYQKLYLLLPGTRLLLSQQVRKTLLRHQNIPQTPHLSQILAITVSVSEGTGRGFSCLSLQTRRCKLHISHFLPPRVCFFSPFQPSPSAIPSSANTPASTPGFSRRSLPATAAVSVSAAPIPRMATPLQAKFFA